MNRRTIHSVEQFEDEKSTSMKLFLRLKSRIPREEFDIPVIGDPLSVNLYSISIDVEKGIKLITLQPNDRNMFDKSILKSSGVYLLDTMIDCFLWVGEGAPYFLKVTAFSLADDLFELFSKPEYAEISVVNEKYF